MAFRRRRSAFRSSTGSLGWIRWNRSRKDGTLGVSGCLRPLRGFHILGRTALETLPDNLVEKHVPSRAVQAATSDGNRNGVREAGLCSLVAGAVDARLCLHGISDSSTQPPG